MGLFGPSKKKLEQMFQEGYFALYHSKTPDAHQRAEELLGKAAQAGHLEAMFYYGQALDGHSTGIEALKWAEKAGEAGYDKAIRYCVDHYLEEYLTLNILFCSDDPTEEWNPLPEEVDPIRRWAKRGAAQGLPGMQEILAALEEKTSAKSFYQLALAYEAAGKPGTALIYMEDLAGQGYLPAILWCAKILASGVEDKAKELTLVRADRKKADKWLLRAAETAQALLEGNHVKADPERACALYLQIAEAAGAKHDVKEDETLSLRLYRLAEAFFVRQQYEIAMPLIRYAADVGYVGAHLRMAQLLQRGLPGLDADHEAAAREYQKWYENMKPGNGVQFGAYPRKNVPDVYDTRADFDPLFWQVLEVKDGRVLMISYKGLEIGSSGTPAFRILDDFEQAFAEERPFNLTEQDFERCVAGKEVEPFKASTYAAAGLAWSLGLTFELHPDDMVSVQPKEKVDFDDPAQKQEWEGRRNRVGALLMKPAAWALEGGKAVVDGKVQPSAGLEDVVLRPAVWVRMPPAPEQA